MRPRVPLLAMCLTALLLPACAMTIGPLHPAPNIAIAPQPKSLRLSLAPGILDSLDIPLYGNHVTVQAWRETLADGFRSGFAGGYRLAGGADADLTLTLDEVRLELGDFEPARARIQYKATLSAGGVVLKRTAGTAVKPAPAFAGRAATASDLVAADVDGAVEAMYEQIAKELAATSGG